MKPFEQVKIIFGEKVEDVEEGFNAWYRELAIGRENVPTLKNTPIKITDRVMCIRNYEGEETYVLAVFYIHYDIEPQEQGTDRGAAVAGLSMIRGKKR